MTKWMYLFSEFAKVVKVCSDVGVDVRDLLGGKGAIFGEMYQIGVPVPPGFTITTEACNAYYDSGDQFPEGMWEQTLEALHRIEEQTSKKFGDPKNPLLVSVRSGAKFPMPGMMDTVLNVGINDETAKGMVELTQNKRFVYDAYRRLIQMYGSVVLDVPDEAFEEVLEDMKREKGGEQDTDLTAEDLKELVERFKKVVKEHKGFDFPQDPIEQLRLAIEAVFRSWNSKRAIDYRNAAGIPHDLGTAVNIVTMVFGNMGWDSGTGVAFTRNPSTGEKKLWGEYLLNAQGEDVVAGIRTPSPIEKMAEELPEAYAQFVDIVEKLEKYYRDMLDVEFIIECGRVWILQTRSGKRTSRAAVRIAVDMLEDNIISQRETIFRVTPEQLARCYSPRLPDSLSIEPIARGVNASPGVATGLAVFSSDVAERLGKDSKNVILLRPFVIPDDINGILASRGVVTMEGGATSHAAVVSRQFGIPCVTGVVDLRISLENKRAGNFAGNKIINEGDVITIDGTSGYIYPGEVPLIQVKTQDDPYLAKYASLVWGVNSINYCNDKIGTLWVLRDTIKQSKAPVFLNSRPSVYRKMSDSARDANRVYIAFCQPDYYLFKKILQTMHWSLDRDLTYVVWGLLYNLSRLLQDEVGTGNHHKIYRPLNDPEISFIGQENLYGVKLNHIINHDGPMFVQIVGLEFFNINHYLKNYLDWGNIQIWLAINIRDPWFYNIWFLDRINPLGEGIVQGDHDLAGFIVVKDGKKLSKDETKRLYNSLRLREIYWEFYEIHKTSKREIIDVMTVIASNGAVDRESLSLCQRIGLVNSKGQITALGYSLLHDQQASDRKNITFYLGESNG